MLQFWIIKPKQDLTKNCVFFWLYSNISQLDKINKIYCFYLSLILVLYFNPLMPGTKLSYVLFDVFLLSGVNAFCLISKSEIYLNWLFKTHNNEFCFGCEIFLNEQILFCKPLKSCRAFALCFRNITIATLYYLKL